MMTISPKRGDETKDGDERVIKRDGELLFIIIIIIINAIRAVTSVGTCNRQAITERTEWRNRKALQGNTLAEEIGIPAHYM